MHTLDLCKTIWDSAIVKVLDGIAGSGKSSSLANLLAGVPYNRYTSTNRLKRDALARFGGHCDTIAGGLFTTIDGRFFQSEKDGAPIVVIDEILQTDVRVLEWVRHHREECNIFILTDTHQMLAPQGGKAFLQAFEKFKQDPFVECIDMPKTYRAQNAETEDYFYRCFQSVDDNKSLFYEYKKRHGAIAFDELEFNEKDIYITHTNDLEKKLYQRFDLGSRYDLDLIPKGSIARKEPANPKRYPIVPQADVSASLGGYYQIGNVGTPTRYQGSECHADQKLYYIVTKGARVEPREWYTVATRCKDIRSLQIVEAPREETVPFVKYWGKPVKTTAVAALPEDTTAANGEKLTSLAGDGKIGRLDLETIQEALADVQDTPDIHYKTDCMTIGGRFIAQKREDERQQKNQITMHGLLTRCPEFSYSFLPDFYKRYEDIQENFYSEIFSEMPVGVCMKRTVGETARTSYRYGIDLQASYPHILKFAKLPIDSEFISQDESQDKYLTSDENFYTFCTVMNSRYVPDGSVISYETAELLATMNDDEALFGWLGTCKARRGSYMGDKLMDMATDCKETNELRRTIRYGLAERQYVYACEWDIEHNTTAYAISDRDNHAPLMWAIKDAQLQIMLTIKKLLARGYAKTAVTVADGMYFDYFESVKQLGDDIHQALPWVDFRIFEQNANDKNDCILYRTYKDLPTRYEKKKIRERERLRAKRASKK